MITNRDANAERHIIGIIIYSFAQIGIWHLCWMLRENNVPRHSAQKKEKVHSFEISNRITLKNVIIDTVSLCLDICILYGQ